MRNYVYTLLDDPDMLADVIISRSQIKSFTEEQIAELREMLKLLITLSQKSGLEAND